MKNLFLKLKLLEIRLKNSGKLGYLIYCIIGIIVMLIIWGTIFGLLGYIFLTPLINIKYLGDITLLKLIAILFAFFFLKFILSDKNSTNK